MEQPLVSIVVVTYNSSEFIIETLESIKNQTYKNIELIITDDHSKDSTIEKVEGWLFENSAQFHSAKLCKSIINTGVPQNCNRGVSASDGQWLKLIAGDDTLPPNSITAFINFIKGNPESKNGFLVGKVNIFNNIGTMRIWPEAIFPEERTAQLKKQVFGGFIKAPGTFLSRKKLNDLGNFNEKYKLFEDDPLWNKYLLAGNKFFYVDEIVVNYRVGHPSVSNSNTEGISGMSRNFYNCLRQFKKDLILSLVCHYKFKLAALLSADIILFGWMHGRNAVTRRLSNKYYPKLKRYEAKL